MPRLPLAKRYTGGVGSLALVAFLIPDRLEGPEGLFYVPGHAQLGGEDVPHHPLLVYDVRHPTGEESESVGHPVELPYLAPFVAEQDKGQAVLLDEPLVGPHGIRTYPY